MSTRNIESSPIYQAAMDRVKSEWKDNYINIAIDLCCMLQYIDGGIFHYYAKIRELEEPFTHNQWVVMVGQLSKKGYIRKTTAAIKSRSPHNHMNTTPVWESRLFTGQREDWDVHKYDALIAAKVGPLAKRKKNEP